MTDPDRWQHGSSPICGQPYDHSFEEIRPPQQPPQSGGGPPLFGDDDSIFDPTGNEDFLDIDEDDSLPDLEDLREGTEAILGQLVQTPLDPPRLVLNPGRGDEAVTPVCPECGEPIRGVRTEHERRFVCGCDEVRTFTFEDGDSDD